MIILIMTIPVTITLVFLFILLFLSAVRRGQFDDLETPQHSIFLDNETNIENNNKTNGDIDNAR